MLLITLCFLLYRVSNIQDGYTTEVTGREGVRVLVAVRAKPNRDRKSRLNREYFRSFLDVSLYLSVILQILVRIAYIFIK